MLSMFFVIFSAPALRREVFFKDGRQHEVFFQDGYQVAEVVTSRSITQSSSTSTSSSSSSSNNSGAIVAGVLGLGIVVGILAYMLNKNKRNQTNAPQKFLPPKHKPDSTTYSTRTSL